MPQLQYAVHLMRLVSGTANNPLLYHPTPTSVSVIRVGHRAATMLPIYDELHCTPPILSVDGLSIGVAGERAFFEFGDRAAHGMAFPAEILPMWSRLYCVHPIK